MQSVKASLRVTGTILVSFINDCRLKPLSYTILLEGVFAEKKCPQKHGGVLPEMTPLPWLLVPPAHENTTVQAQN